MSVFALSSDAQERDLLDFWNDDADVFILGRPNYLGCGNKSAICALKFGVSLIIWGLIFLVCHDPSHFLSIKSFPNWTNDYFMSAPPPPPGSDDKEIKVSEWSRTVLYQKSQWKRLHTK